MLYSPAVLSCPALWLPAAAAAAAAAIQAKLPELANTSFSLRKAQCLSTTPPLSSSHQKFIHPPPKKYSRPPKKLTSPPKKAKPTWVAAALVWGKPSVFAQLPIIFPSNLFEEIWGTRNSFRPVNSCFLLNFLTHAPFAIFTRCWWKASVVKVICSVQNWLRYEPNHPWWARRWCHPKFDLLWKTATFALKPSHPG